MKRIGVTGPTGAGKTTVLNALEAMGCRAIDCDALYHGLLETSPALLEELTERFGKSILNTQGKLDRKALAPIVFADPEALADLNRITHRHVALAIEDIAAQAKADGCPGVVVDAIALWESGQGDLCDVTLAVTAPAEVRVKRIMARDDISEDYARARVNAQKPGEFYTDRCDYTIVNDGSRSPRAIARQVEKLFRPILHDQTKEDL